ncbi:MAG TPA: HIT family protein [Sphingomicrobium sp.]|nr:HIT family protein [Sphingomicrobium sp.]
MTNETMRKFGFPETLVREFENWVVLVRPAQVTLGSLVLCAKSDATGFGALEPAAFSELGEIVPAIERVLKSFCDYERINYLMLMMVDPNVHFHIIPRYSDPRTFNDMAFPDTGWPGPPDLKAAIALDSTALSQLRYVLADYLGVNS